MRETDLIFRKGDATIPKSLWGEPRLIVHVCNNIGAWGGGFTGALDKRFGEGPRRTFLDDQEGAKLGSIAVTSIDPTLHVINMVAQDGIAGFSKYEIPLRLTALYGCLIAVRERHAIPLGASVHMPRIGCGLAGGKWEDVENLVRTAICRHGLYAVVYDL